MVFRPVLRADPFVSLFKNFSKSVASYERELGSVDHRHCKRPHSGSQGSCLVGFERLRGLAEHEVVTERTGRRVEAFHTLPRPLPTLRMWVRPRCASDLWVLEPRDLHEIEEKVERCCSRTTSRSSRAPSAHGNKTVGLRQGAADTSRRRDKRATTSFGWSRPAVSQDMQAIKKSERTSSYPRNSFHNKTTWLLYSASVRLQRGEKLSGLRDNSYSFSTLGWPGPSRILSMCYPFLSERPCCTSQCLRH